MVLRKCPRCNGTGKRPVWEYGYLSAFLDILTGEDESTGPLCKGRGYIDDGTIEVRGRHEVHWYD